MVSAQAGRARATALVGLVALLAVVLVVQGRARPADAAGSWWSPGHAARVAVTVGAGDAARQDKVVDVALDGAALLAAAGVGGTFDPDSVRVLQVDATGAAVGQPLPAQHVGGRLTFVLPGALAAGASRTVHVYLDNTGAGHAPQAVTPQVTLTSGTDEGQPTFVVGNQVGTWHVQKPNGSLSSLVDLHGRDWIGFNPTPGSQAGGEYRGIPNFPHPQGTFHPGSAIASTEVVAQGPLKVTLRATSNDGKWSYTTSYFPRHATSTVTEVDPAQPWWWLYEGTPAGGVATGQEVVRPTPAGPVATPIHEAWSGDLSPEEWAFFAAPAASGAPDRSFYMAHHQDDALIDSHYVMTTAQGSMTVFGFGRSGVTGLLTSVPQSFTMGLMDTVDPTAGAATVRGAYRDLAVSVGAAESQATATTAAPTSTTAGPTTTLPPSGDGYGYVPVSPTRLMDTRFDGSGPFGAGEVRRLQVAGQGGVPADAAAIVANATVTQGVTDGYVALSPSGGALPGTSNLNWLPGETVPNLVTVAVGGDGGVQVLNAKGTAHVILDVVGYFPGTGGGRFHPVSPVRVADTRLGGGPVAPGGSLTVDVDAVTDLPAGEVSAVVLNVTAANGTAATFLTAHPYGTPRPNASNLNPLAGQTVPNAVVTGVDADGRFSVFNAEGHTDIVVDLLGWYDDGSGDTAGGLRYHPLAPVRVADTRITTGAMTAGGTFSPVVAGVATVPAQAKAVAVNVTVAAATGPSYLTVFPAGVVRPFASLQNLERGMTRANMAMVGLGEGGRLSAYNAQGSTEVIYDVAGWFG